jgi:hypothetical protein
MSKLGTISVRLEYLFTDDMSNDEIERNDIAFRADNISLSTLAIDDLIDDAYRHIQEHGEIIVDDDSEELNITFTGEE